jgi:hypothetical protein
MRKKCQKTTVKASQGTSKSRQVKASRYKVQVKFKFKFKSFRVSVVYEVT